jgi:anti-sigma factor RsiW
MSQVCDSIDTLSMSYLDEELAPEEKRELELHLLECSSCRDHVQEARQEIGMLRQRLSAFPMPDLVRAKVTHSLDREDAQVRRKLYRERLSRWALPGTSIVAAAAALLVFVFLPSQQGTRSLSTVVASRQAQPFQITGAATGPWLEQQIAGTVAPSFDPGVELMGGSVSQVDARTVAHLVYEVGTTGRQRFQLEAFLFAAHSIELNVGRAVATDSGRVLYVSSLDDGRPAITYVDEKGVGYVFISSDFSQRALLFLVLTSELIDRARGGR